MAFKIAFLVISEKTIRFELASLRFSVLDKCQAIASPSRSSSLASHTVSAFFDKLLSSLTSFYRY